MIDTSSSQNKCSYRDISLSATLLWYKFMVLKNGTTGIPCCAVFLNKFYVDLYLSSDILSARYVRDTR